MADDSKAMKVAKKEARKEAAAKLSKLNKELKIHSNLHPVGQIIARPLIAATAGRAAGMVDGRYGTPENQHTAAIAGAVVLPLAGLGLAFVNPTFAGLVADAGAGCAGAMQYLSGQKQGQEAKAKSLAPAG